MRPAGGRRGANAIEFALVLPVLLMLVTGIMDYGYAFAVRTAATTAARVGARVGAVTPQDQSPDTAAIDAAVAKWAAMGLPGTPTMAAFRIGTPERMVVRVRVDLNALVGLVLGPTTLEVTAVQRMEDQP